MVAIPVKISQLPTGTMLLGEEIAPFVQNGATIQVSTNQLATQIVTNAEAFGAVGDGVTDDTTALQNAINYMVTNKACLVLGGNTGEANNYKITAALTIPFSQFWTIRGASRNVTITQNTNNTPIFSFTQDLTHSWRICDLSLTWSSLQSSSNTKSAAIWFTGDFNRFNFQLERLTISNGFRGISNDTAFSPLTWGTSIRDVVIFDCSGSAVNLDQAVSSGQPNIEIDGLYVSCDNVVASEPIIKLSTADSFSLDHIEANTLNNGSQFLVLTSSTGSIGSIKFEGATFVGGTTVVDIVNTDVSIKAFSFLTMTINAPADSVTLMGLRGGHGSLSIDVTAMTFAAAITGALYVVGVSDSSSFSVNLAHTPVNLIGTSNAFLTQVGGTGSANRVWVEQWDQFKLSDDIGDANTTFAVGVNQNVIQYLSTITADRTVTLTDEKGGANTNLYNGVPVRVVHNAGTPGAFNLLVKDSGGGTIGTLASTNGMLEFRWQRFAWRLMSKTTWTGTG